MSGSRVLLVLFGVYLVICVLLLYPLVLLETEGVHTTGRIVVRDLRIRDFMDDVPQPYVIAEFETADGKTHRSGYLKCYGMCPPDEGGGEPLPLVYRSGDPRSVRTDSDVSIWMNRGVFCLLLPAALLLAVLIFYGLDWAAHSVAAVRRRLVDSLCESARMRG